MTMDRKTKSKFLALIEKKRASFLATNMGSTGGTKTDSAKLQTRLHSQSTGTQCFLGTFFYKSAAIKLQDDPIRLCKTYISYEKYNIL